MKWYWIKTKLSIKKAEKSNSRAKLGTCIQSDLQFNSINLFPATDYLKFFIYSWVQIFGPMLMIFLNN